MKIEIQRQRESSLDNINDIEHVIALKLKKQGQTRHRSEAIHLNEDRQRRR